MNQPDLIFKQVCFKYQGTIDPLLENLVFHVSKGWTGVIGANGSGKSTLLKLSAGHLSPLSGTIDAPSRAIYCAQRTDEAPRNFREFLLDNDRDAMAIKTQLKINDDWFTRWQSLSHGERKRSQIGIALWMQPNLLAVDEPGNHLDRQARELLMHELQRFKGVGLLVSHDRDLLDQLCRQCLFLDPPRVSLFSGNFSQARETMDREASHQFHIKVEARRQQKRLVKETSRRRDVTRQSRQKISKRGLNKKDHDRKSKVDLARLSGKDGDAGRRLKQMEIRLEKARERTANIFVKKTYYSSINMPGSVYPKQILFHLSPGTLPLGPERQLHFPELTCKRDQRIAVIGPNGGGKSTLLDYIYQRIKSTPVRTLYLPQEIPAVRASQLILNVRSLARQQKGKMMNVISCLGSRPDRLLESKLPSPGETRKLLLALGMIDDPHLIILDEPTNHLDLPSIEAMEDAFKQTPAALLMVSHDFRFLENLNSYRWRIKSGQKVNTVEI